MSAFEEAANRLARRIEAALDAAAARLARRLPGPVAIEAETGRRRIELAAGAAALEFGTGKRPADPFITRAIADSRDDFAAAMTEALRHDS